MHSYTYATSSIIVLKCLFLTIVLFVCMFFGVYRPIRKFFHSNGDVTITANFILIYARHSWSLGCEGSLVCHTYCDTGYPFIMVIQLRGPVTLTTFAECLPVELSLPVFTTLICCAGIRTPNLPLTGPILLPSAPPPRSIVLQYFMHQCNCN